MGCGGSKENVEEYEKPLNPKMDIVDLEKVDGIFLKCSKIIIQLEPIRKTFFDDLIDIYYQTGAWAYICPDPQKALECSIWRLGVDNKGNTSEIGFNTHGPCFEGGCNSEEGNNAANNLIEYMQNLTTKFKEEDIHFIFNELNEIVNEISKNMDSYVKEIGDKYESHPLKGFQLCGLLKGNLAKATHALNCAKESSIKIKDLLKEPKFITSNIPNILRAQSKLIEQACKIKQTKNLSISWNLVHNDLRRGKSLNAAKTEYENKIKVRNNTYMQILK